MNGKNEYADGYNQGYEDALRNISMSRLSAPSKMTGLFWYHDESGEEGAYLISGNSENHIRAKFLVECRKRGWTECEEKKPVFGNLPSIEEVIKRFLSASK